MNFDRLTSRCLGGGIGGRAVGPQVIGDVQSDGSDPIVIGTLAERHQVGMFEDGSVPK